MRLGNWLSPSFSNFNPLAVDLLVARAVDKRVVDVTFRQMAENFGLDHSTYAYALKRARRTGTLAFCPACGSADPQYFASARFGPRFRFV